MFTANRRGLRGWEKMLNALFFIDEERIHDVRDNKVF